MAVFVHRKDVRGLLEKIEEDEVNRMRCENNYAWGYLNAEPLSINAKETHGSIIRGNSSIP